MSLFFSAADYCGEHSDSAQIQAAVNAACEAGGIAVIPAKNPRTGKNVWDIDSVILLPDNTVLQLMNAHLRLCDDYVGHMFENANASLPVAETLEGQQKSITIRGLGTSVLDGGRYNGIVEKANRLPGTIPSSENIMIYLFNVSGFYMEGITAENHRYWFTCMTYCENITIRDMTVHSACNVPNQDAFDVRQGCHNVLIENIRGCTGDDMVALNNLHSVRRVAGADPDLHDVILRNLQVYSANGCALVRILTHDGRKIYRILIDGIQETSPYADTDWATAPNPDLFGKLDENNRFVIEPKQVLGEHGYRTDSAIRIGENYWYHDFPASSGDMWGITVRNISVHAQAAVTVACTLYDSVFENIQLYGNGGRAVLFNKGDMRNLTFRDITWTEDCRPHPDDKVIDIPWNSTHTEGFNAFWFGDTHCENVFFENIRVGKGIDTVFGGSGTGTIRAQNVAALSDTTVLMEGSDEKPDIDETYNIQL